MAKIRETLTMEDQFTGPLTQYIRLAENASTSTKQLKDAAQRASATSRIQTAAFNQASAAARAQASALRLQAQQQKVTASATDGLTSKINGLIGAYAGFRSISSLFTLSDTLTQTTARLDMMGDRFDITMNQIYESAQRSRGALMGTADMVSKFGNLAGEAFNSSQELVDFAEQLNKQIALSGASTMAADAAMLQLTQAMSSGVLRGEELNSILEQTPTIAKAIADYMGVSTGVMREMASEGAITAEVVKNAMFAAAEETNAKFEQMPMTWAQVWTSFQNTAIMALQPVLNGINLLANNIETLIPALAGLIGGMLAFAAASAIANGTITAMFAALAANPIVLVFAVGIGIIIGLIAQWVQSVGGLQVAWLMFKNVALTAAEEIYFVMRSVAVGIFDAFGSLVANMAQLAESFVNMWILAANMVIKAINLIPGNNIPLINEVTFGSAAMASYQQAYQERHDSLSAMRADYDMRQMQRAQEIAKAQEGIASGNTTGSSTFSSIPTYDQLAGIADSVSSIQKSVDMTDEDLQSLVDIAERRYVNNINLTSQAPVINVTGQNTGNTAADRMNLANTLRDILVQQVAAGSVQTTAKVV